MNEIYVTSNISSVLNYAVKLASDSYLPIYIFDGTKEDLDNILNLHNEHQKAVVVIKHITKAPMFDMLLPILEESDLHIIAISNKNDLKGAIISRCEVKTSVGNFKDEITAFINKRIVPEVITIEFLCALSEYIIYNCYDYKKTPKAQICINSIICDIQLSTNNILQDELKDRLRSIEL